MPVFSVSTNVDIDDEAQTQFLIAASQATAKLLGKPERYVMVHLQAAQRMLFDGRDAPLAYCELKSIGLPTDRTAEMSEVLCDLLIEHFGIASDRIYIEFSDAERKMFGWDRSTF
ncbi:MAG: hypothetical protein HUJ29_12625 [Gammaproteobacteria bacterium]|nr:hypothetical protein [Gammaproteobacteria bacterium]